MTWPKSTGDAARLLDLPEHRLTNLIRLGKLDVPMVLGRRAWGRQQVVDAARLLGRDDAVLLNSLAADTAPSSPNEGASRG